MERLTTAEQPDLNAAVTTDGQGVLWVSAGGTHTVESTGATTFTSSGTLATNEPYLVIFSNAGTFQYDCAVHGAGMTGRIVVQ